MADPIEPASSAEAAPSPEPGSRVPTAPAPPVAELLDPSTRVTEAPFAVARTRRQPPSYVFFTVVTVVGAALDLASKAWASKRLTGYDPVLLAQKKVIVIRGYLDFQYAQNPGGAWSMLHTLPEVARRPFFLAVSTVASVFIVSVYGRIDKRQWAMRWGLPLALGGAIGNLVDRIRNGWVVDFVHFWFKKRVGEYHWPTFNVADVWIVIGVGLMAIDMFTSRAVRASIAEEERWTGESDADLAPHEVEAPPGPAKT